MAAGRVAKRLLDELLERMARGDVPTEADAAVLARKTPRAMEDALLRTNHPARLEAALAGDHLVPGPDGYVGAPKGVRSMDDVNFLRARFDNILDEGEGVGHDWYLRSHGGTLQATGGDPELARLFADENAFWSPQADPGQQLGMALRGHNLYETGGQLDYQGHWKTGQYYPDSEDYKRYGITDKRTKKQKAARPRVIQEHLRSGRQSRDYLKARLEGTPLPQGLKTGQYYGHLNPFQPPGAPAVNDIWHARNLGYGLWQDGPAPDVSGAGSQAGHWATTPKFSRGLSASEHRYADGETALAAHRASQRQVGGISEWTEGGTQASPWVISKARDLMEQRPSLTWEDALRLANRSHSENFPAYTVYGTYESKEGPYVGMWPGGHPMGADALHDTLEWRNPKTGLDPIYSAMGAYQRPPNQTTGAYTPDGRPTEINRGTASRLLSDLQGDTDDKRIGSAGRAMLDAGEALRGYLDMQDMAAYHKFFPADDMTRIDKARAKKSNVNSLRIPVDHSLPPQKMAALEREMKAFGLSPSDTGDGVTLLSFPKRPRERMSAKAEKEWLAKEAAKLSKMRPKVDEAVRRALGDDAPPVQRGFADMGSITYGKAWERGGGEVTSMMLDALDNPDFPRIAERLSRDPEIKAAALERLKVHAGGGRPDMLRAYEIIANSKGSWLNDLREAARQGIVPVALVTGIFQVAQESEREAGPALL